MLIITEHFAILTKIYSTNLMKRNIMKINYLKSFIFLVIVVLVCMTISFSKEAELQKPCCDILEVLEKIPSTEGTVYWQDIEKLAHVKKQNSKFARVKITYDKSLLNEKEKKVLLHLVEAAKCMNEIYLMQSYSKNLEIQKQLSNSKNPLDKVYLSYFDICFGPFDCLDENKNYIDSALFPETANFYPEDMTKEEFNNWIKDHPKDKENFNSWYTVIRRYGNVLKAIPYSQEYKTQLEKSAMHLKEAAKLSDNESLKKFLNMRADSFLSNEYYNSELAWMDVKDSKFEVVIGPYEVYTDRLFNNKTAFEAFICLNDPEEEKKLEMYANHLRLMEENLPLANEDKNFARSFNSPIRVVQEVYVAGDARAGIQTSAFNLPNDEKVRETKGCKKVMLKNVMEAKFNKSLIPIAKRVIEPTQLKYVTFLGYFNHVLLHELSHGLGPGIIKKDGKKEDTKVFLEETYSIIEEAKADTLGIYNQLFLIDKGKIP